MNSLSHRVLRVLQPPLQKRCIADFSPELILSNENLIRTVSKFQAMPLIRMQTQEPVRKAAVLIPLCLVDKKVSLLFTLRTSHLRSHRGQVSFPGGMQDSKDKSLQHTALRETKEELGIDENKVTVWGNGNVIVARADTGVMPVIGTIKDELDVKNLTINPAEVEEVFTVPLETLCRSDKLGFTQFRTGYSTPVYLGGVKRIWGLTAIITNVFLRCLLPSQLYAHKIKFLAPIRNTHKRMQHNKTL